MSKGGGVNIPSTYTVRLGSDGSTVRIDADLDNIQVKQLPRIELGDINMHVKELPTITLNSNIAITQIPDVRAHLPAHFNFGISILGFDLINFCLSGEAQVITEKYVPHRVELCD